MNAGFLSYIILTLSLILIGFGWRAQAIGNGSGKAAAVFCLAWIVGAASDWRYGGATGTFVYVPLLALGAHAVRTSSSWKETASIASFGCLLGAVFSLVQLLETLDPLVIVLHPSLDPVLLVGLLVAAYVRMPAAQLALLSIALVVNDVYMGSLYAEWQPAALGDREFQDAWWLGAATARAATVFGVSAVRRAKAGGGRIRGWLRVRR
ncbi:YphA family membrane protein [Paenibacillus sp.]|uniref:YphA family membrane protein n=1 Tax=Paenibacillus sp. TaxID=58172 RepID=UPI002D3A95B5|nr:hypothetical protein [Paenibacillus sp.]HZG57483.1 hypothetical protein [Paenibacillus sp.]